MSEKFFDDNELPLEGDDEFGPDGPAVEVDPGAAVAAGGNEVGRVVCAAGAEALAVLPLELPEGRLDIAGTPVTPAPLEDGLAR